MAADHDTLRDAWRVERARLSRQADDLQVRFDDIVAGAELTSTDDEHDPEGATIAYERAQVWALLQQTRSDLAAVDDALVGLGLGELPVCSGCDGPIATERLLALPGVRTCIDCARRPVP